MAAEQYDWAALADAVKSRREAMGLTQGQLAKRAGVGASTIRNVEQHARDSYNGRTLDALEHAVLAPVGWAHSVLTNQNPGQYHSIRVVDATVGDILRRLTPSPGNIGEETSLSDMQAWREVMRQVGASTPPDADSEPEPDGSRPAGALANLETSDGNVRPAPFSSMRALGPLFDCYAALSAIPDPSLEERQAIGTVWDLIERARQEREGAERADYSGLDLVETDEGKIEIVEHHGKSRHTVGLYATKQEALEALRYVPWTWH